MKRIPTTLAVESSEGPQASVDEPPTPLRFPFEASSQSDRDTFHTDRCEPFERLFVKTRNSFYELVVLAGCPGEVLIRGGRFLADFRRARVTGSTAGGSALKPRIIEVGLKMEIALDGQIISTSTVLALSRACF